MYQVAKPKLLIVDDSGVLLRNVKSLLDDKYDVSIAISGKVALKLIPALQPDLVILDYEMPEMNGKETFDEIRKLPAGAHVPIIYLTSADDRETIMQLMAQKPSGYVLKPVDINRLRESIANALVILR